MNAKGSSKGISASRTSSFLTPKNMVIRVDDQLTFPNMSSISSTIMRSTGDDIFCRTACESTPLSLAESPIKLASHPKLEEEFPGLFDELSRYSNFRVHKDLTSQDPKVQQEFAVMRSLDSIRNRMQTASASPFLDLIKVIHRKNRQGSDTFRNSPVHIAPDDRGNIVMFPHHSLCASLMENLFLFLSKHIDSHPSICAAVAYVAIIHAHPFTDGNGRTARILFNIILRDYVPTAHFVPVRSISLLTHGGFLIRLRRAIHFGDWERIQQFFSSAIRLSDWSQRNIQ